jgi:uncharacterized protein YndB with AHSA1/START domain
LTLAAAYGIVISMNVDMWASLGEVDRRLHTGARDGQEVRVLVVEKRYDAPRPEVWHAVITAERIARWLAPVTGDLVLGGRYQVEGNAGGTVLRCEEPELLEITWEFGGGVTWVVVTLTEDGSGTRLRLEHTAPVDETVSAEFGPGAVGIGWEMGLGGLRLHLADPEAPRPDPDYTDPGYSAFVRASGTAWAEADAAAGTDPEEAKAAAERCIAAYTALPPDEG